MIFGLSLTRRLVRRVLKLAPSALGEGPPAVHADGDYSGPRFVQILAAVAGILIHGGLFVATGRAGFLWVAILAAAYLAFGIPLVIRMADVSPNLATWADFFTLMALATVMGDPITFLAWLPLVVVANLIYVDSLTGVRNAVVMSIMAGCYFLVMVNTSERLFDASLARAYMAATLLMWVLSSVGYSLAIGGAVNRQLAAVQAAHRQRDDAEARLRAEASRLRAVLEEAPIGLLLQGSDDKFEYANAPALEMLEITEEKLMSEGTVTSMKPSSVARVEREVGEAKEQGKPFLIEFETAGGRIVELRGRHVDLGDTWTTVNTMRDLTPERDARRHIARLRTLVENGRTQMVIWNRRGEIVLANRVFREMWSPERAVEGRLVTEVVGEQIRPLIDLPDLDAGRNLELEVLVPGGQRIWADLSIADFPDPFDDEWLRSMSVRDLTEVATARRQLEELVVSKDRFIASVSHELRTPLTVVVGLAAELAVDPSRFTGEEVKEFASLIASQATDVTSIVEDLLTVARAEAGVLTVNCQRIDLVELVSQVMTSMASDLRTKVNWSPSVADWVWADPVRLRQIVRNLVVNADRHGGPVIEIETCSGTLMVKDNGPPLAEHDRERIFEPYVMTRQAGRTDSVGLGLAVCRLLSRLMEGDVVYSHDGDRAIFTLNLLASDRSLRPASPATSAAFRNLG